MEEKILCPWCGAEMRMKVYNDCAFTGGRMLGEAWRAFYRCHLCGAQGPEETRSAGNKAEEAARAAALRRYTPQLKPMTPMTFEEVERLACSASIDDAIPLYLEDIDGDNGWEISYQLRRLCFNAKDGYDKEWRCWARKPTDEERSAAEWQK